MCINYECLANMMVRNGLFCISLSVKCPFWWFAWVVTGVFVGGGCFVACLWLLCGFCVACLWLLCGLFVACVWLVCG